MGRERRAQQQLDFAWVTEMRWEDLPAEVRKEASEQLGSLLLQAVGVQRLAEEVGDDDQ